MPKFYLHLQRDDEQIPDEEGQDFGSFEEARAAAMAALCEIAGDAIKASELVVLEAILMEDDTGKLVAKVTTGQALQPLLPTLTLLPDGAAPLANNV
jgi:hypothetical protein